jgi:hypothetical protein
VGSYLDLQDDIAAGDQLAANIDRVSLATDLFPAGVILKAPARALAKGLVKGIVKGDIAPQVAKELGKIWKTGSNKWKDTKAWILRNNSLPANTHVHHAFLHQLKGKREPKWLINQWWNLVPLDDWAKYGFKNSQEMHWAIDGKNGMRFSTNPYINDYYRIIKAYPQWSKAVAASVAENILASDIKFGQWMADQLFDQDSYGRGRQQDGGSTKSAQ